MIYQNHSSKAGPGLKTMPNELMSLTMIHYQELTIVSLQRGYYLLIPVVCLETYHLLMLTLDCTPLRERKII